MNIHNRKPAPIKPDNNQAGIQRHKDEQAHAHGKSSVDILAGRAVLDRLAEQDDHRDHGVQPESGALSRGGHCIEPAPEEQAEQQHPEKEHPEVDEQAQGAPEQHRQQAAQ
ncbi:luciferase family protein [Pseudomonas fluorescens]|uniref:luciferase family protein n=1 Tax=Pseudomonas fluorescens TaxID=294 RepID=UPI00333A4288